MTEIEEIIMGLILNAGSAKQHIYEALQQTKDGDYAASDESIRLADQAINDAHSVQSAWLAKEAAGEVTEITAIFVHAQDHLMTTMTEMNLIKELISMRRELDAKEAALNCKI